MKDAAEEAASLKSEGFKAMKMFVGLLPIRQDLQRVSAVREAIGPEVFLLSSVVFTFVFKESSSSSVSICLQMGLMVDSNHAYSLPTAICFARCFHLP